MDKRGDIEFTLAHCMEETKGNSFGILLKGMHIVGNEEQYQQKLKGERP